MYESMSSYGAEPVSSTDDAKPEEKPAQLSSETLDDMLASVNVTKKPETNEDSGTLYAGQTLPPDNYSNNSEPSQSYHHPDQDDFDGEDNEWGSIKYH